MRTRKHINMVTKKTYNKGTNKASRPIKKVKASRPIKKVKASRPTKKVETKPIISNIHEIRERLAMLLHAMSCEKDAGTCTLKYCNQAKINIDHALKCNLSKCNEKHCISSRIVLDHFLHCKSKKCEVCPYIRNLIQQRKVEYFIECTDYGGTYGTYESDKKDFKWYIGMELRRFEQDYMS